MNALQEPNNFFKTFNRLGPARCVINVKKIKKFVSVEAKKALLIYTMRQCKDHDTELEELRDEVFLQIQILNLLKDVSIYTYSLVLLKK